MKCYYDLHIHSALSPCASEDMTPNNIVNMSVLKGLDVIAVSDHNSAGNVRSVMKAAEGKILVIPAMEIETAEEVHLLSLFPTVDAAEEMEKIIKENLSFIKNRREMFGTQLYMDENDNVTGEEENLLVHATELDIYDASKYVSELSGVIIPAHIDRSSYSIISNLGFIPPDIGFSCVEITERNLSSMKEDYKNYNIITNSDAHYLWDINEKNHFVEIDNKITKKFLETLCKIT